MKLSNKPSGIVSGDGEKWKTESTRIFREQSRHEPSSTQRFRGERTEHRLLHKYCQLAHMSSDLATLRQRLVQDVKSAKSSKQRKDSQPGDVELPR